MNVEVKSNTRETTGTATMPGVQFGPDRREPYAKVALGGSLCVTSEQRLALERAAGELAIAACEANARALALMFPHVGRHQG